MITGQKQWLLLRHRILPVTDHRPMPAFCFTCSACLAVYLPVSLPVCTCVAACLLAQECCLRLFNLSIFASFQIFFLLSCFIVFSFSFILVSLCNRLIWTLIITIYAPMIYTAPCVMLLMRAASIARYQVFWARNGTRLSARCHFTGPKNSRLSGPNPLPLAQVMDAVRIKSITHGAV